MGQARDRGTYEERKALAMAIKDQKERARAETSARKVLVTGAPMPILVALAALDGARMMYKKPSWL